MFVLSQSESFFWPVTVEIPVSGGKTEKHTFEAEFRRLKWSKITELMEADVPNAVFCREAVVGWKGIVDADKQEVPFSPSALDQLLEVPQVAAAMAQAFLKAFDGAKRKN